MRKLNQIAQKVVVVQRNLNLIVARMERQRNAGAMTFFIYNPGQHKQRVVQATQST